MHAVRLLEQVLTEWVKDMFQPLRAWADLRTDFDIHSKTTTNV